MNYITLGMGSGCGVPKTNLTIRGDQVALYPVGAGGGGGGGGQGAPRNSIPALAGH